MEFLTENISLLFIAIGTFFILSGSLGILRFPDFYTRMHPAGVTDSFGAPLVLLGLCIDSGFNIFTLKIILLIVLLLITGPTTTHITAKSALLGKIKPKNKEDF